MPVGDMYNVVCGVLDFIRPFKYIINKYKQVSGHVVGPIYTWYDQVLVGYVCRDEKACGKITLEWWCNSVRWGHVLHRMWSFRRYWTFLIHTKPVKTSLGTRGAVLYMV